MHAEAVELALEIFQVEGEVEDADIDIGALGLRRGDAAGTGGDRAQRHRAEAGLSDQPAARGSGRRVGGVLVLHVV